MKKPKDKKLFKMLLDRKESLSIREDKLLTELTLIVKKRTIKNQIRKYLQNLFDLHLRQEFININNTLTTRQKKFKNKITIEVSNPQTDYKFYKKI